MYRSIFVPIDGSPSSGRAVIEAIRLASWSGSRVHFFHAIDERGIAAAFRRSALLLCDWRETITATAWRILSKAMDRAERAGVACDGTYSEEFWRPIADRVVADIRRVSPDVVVLGSRRDSMQRGLSRSVADVLRLRVAMPVLVVRDRRGAPRSADESSRSAAFLDTAPISA